MFHAHPLGLLERAGLRKAALDAGFDVLTDAPHCVLGSSSHAPLSCVVAKLAEGGGYGVGLSMAAVVRALEASATGLPLDVEDAGTAALIGAASPMAGWRRVEQLVALEPLLARAWALSRALPNELERRYERAVAEVGDTEREATVRQRIGQSLFRQGLMTLWGGRCAITGLAVPELLRASHAKPWAVATDVERLDVFNGLLLAAHLDAAFDAGLITVQHDGVVAVSSALPADAAGLLGLTMPLRVDLQPAHEPYLQWHRDQVFRQ
jgi:putative restriction endonuclease